MTIPVEFYRQIKDRIVFTARTQSVARRLINTRLVGGGIAVQQWTYDQANEVSDALLTYAFTDTGEDTIELSRSDVPIPVLHKEFRIGRRDLAAAQRGGFALNASTASSAAYKVMNLENKIVLDGYTVDGSNYEIKGLYQSAGNTVSTSYDFGTSGNPLKAVAEGIGELMEDEITGPYNLVLNPTQYMELAISETDGGNPELPAVQKLLEGGEIITTSWQTAGTGMITASMDSGFFELVIPQDMTYETEVLQKSKDLWGRVYECIVPVVYDTNAICKLASI